MKIVNSFRRSRRKNQEPPRRNVVLIGDGGCGKTCLVMTFKSGVFPLGKYIPTIFEAYAVAFELDKQPVELGISDNAGQEGYERLRALSYGNADCVLLCFAVDSSDSLENAKKWAREVRNFRPTVPIVLVANKTDLRDDATLQSPAIPTVRGEEVAQQVGARAYVECSAKTNHGVAEIFETVARAAFAANPRRKRVRAGVQRCFAAIRRFARRVVGRPKRPPAAEQREHAMTYVRSESISPLEA